MKIRDILVGKLKFRNLVGGDVFSFGSSICSSNGQHDLYIKSEKCYIRLNDGKFFSDEESKLDNPVCVISGQFVY